MATHVHHRRLKAEDGERFSLLLEGEPALPLFYPAVYSVEYRRSRGLASSTIWNDEEVLKHLLVWAHNAKIGLDARFEQGQFLTDAEIASYARAAKQHHRRLKRNTATAQIGLAADAGILKQGREACRAPQSIASSQPRQDDAPRARTC